MTPHDLDLLGFYRELVAHNWPVMEACAHYLPDGQRIELLDLVATGKALVAAAERARERANNTVPFLDDLDIDFTGERGND